MEDFALETAQAIDRERGTNVAQLLINTRNGRFPGFNAEELAIAFHLENASENAEDSSDYEMNFLNQSEDGANYLRSLMDTANEILKKRNG